MSVSELSVTYQTIGDLKTNSRNARTHSRRQVHQIAESIKEFGFIVPVLVDEYSNIIAGNGRVEAAKLAGMSQVPTIRVESLTPDQVRAFMLADNRLAENAAWDTSALSIEFEHLLKVNFDVTVTGFEKPEIDLVLSSPKKNPDPDDAFELIDAPQTVTKTGDLWQLGRHQILCASALEPCSYSKLLGNKRANLVFVSPFCKTAFNGQSLIQHRECQTRLDATSDSDLVSSLTSILNLFAEYSTPNSAHLVCADSNHVLDLIGAAQPVYDSLVDVCVWMNKGARSLHRVDELIFVFRNGTEQHAKDLQLSPCRCDGSNVEYAASQPAESRHDHNRPLTPTRRPVALVADALLAYSARGDLVLDPFLGCGATLFAAERTGRCCYGIEMDARYVDTAIERWQRYTGEYAINTATGKRFAEIRRENLESSNGCERQ